ncbi:MAG: SDR family NAD(P)-dependent oxidoreductase [Actinomycetota bacterium]|nr:SDR family NAD(P)-dependent oxidoreductase [Acidimicrobiia bacterium]MDQ3147722.1 SDR family NAD(P)-dependent oxidoreductase [Actinomycetota bacterium]
MELSGKRVLITGASRGIGAALAESFAGAGARVALVARSGTALEELAGRLGGTAHRADLADPAQVSGLVGRIEADGGAFDVLVNNAGIDAGGTFHLAAPEDIEVAYQVNLLAPVELCRQVLPGMLQRKGGHIVNVSSLAGVGAFPGLTIYSSTKAGLTHFTAGLRADLRGTPVRTTVVELGPVPTDMLDHIDDHRQIAASFRRFYQLRLLVDVPKEQVAEDVVAAVRTGRRHVRHPRRALAFPLLTEAPRRLTEVLLTGVRPRS